MLGEYLQSAADERFIKDQFKGLGLIPIAETAKVEATSMTKTLTKHRKEMSELRAKGTKKEREAHLKEHKVDDVIKLTTGAHTPRSN